MLVYRAPQPAPLAVNRDDHFIQVPLAAPAQSCKADAPGNAQPKLHRPALHRLVCKLNARVASSSHDHALVERETVVQPHRIAHHIGRKAIAQDCGLAVTGMYCWVAGFIADVIAASTASSPKVDSTRRRAP